MRQLLDKLLDGIEAIDVTEIPPASRVRLILGVLLQLRREAGDGTSPKVEEFDEDEIIAQILGRQENKTEQLQDQKNTKLQ